MIYNLECLHSQKQVCALIRKNSYNIPVQNLAFSADLIKHTFSI